MANWYSDQILKAIGNPLLGGLQGSPNQPRSTEVRGGIEVWRWSFTQGQPNTVAAGDTMDIAYLKVQTRVYFLAYSTATAVSIGTYDPNNPTGPTTNPTLFGAGLTSAPPAYADITGPLGIQVGLDNLGDQSPGNKAPMFGAAPIVVRLTFTAAPAAAAVVSGYMFVVEGQAS